MGENVLWLELPEDIWRNILHRLGAVEILNTAEKVCTTWRRMCKYPSMWRVIDMRNDGDLGSNPYSLDKMCRRAVDRSQGELADIHMEYFVSDDLLSYLVERSKKLRRLSFTYGMISEGFVEAVQKLPLLEELSLTHTGITIKAIEALGRFCPRLKSFELNNSCYTGTGPYSGGEDRRNDKAFGIAKNLPALQHLQLIGNDMTNEGLLAILDGCPHLVSLDLRLCQNVSLDQVLLSRISRHVKDFKSPDDSMGGFSYKIEPWGDDISDNVSDGDGVYYDDDDDEYTYYDYDAIYGDKSDMYGDYDYVGDDKYW